MNKETLDNIVLILFNINNYMRVQKQINHTQMEELLTTNDKCLSKLLNAAKATEEVKPLKEILKAETKAKEQSKEKPVAPAKKKMGRPKANKPKYDFSDLGDFSL